MPKIVLIDNYDSFTYNLFQYISSFNKDTLVYKNDEINAYHLAKLKPDKLVISPGPGKPSTNLKTMKIIEFFHDKIPVLGVCLGHQCIGEFFGGKITKAFNPAHGKKVLIENDGKTIYKKLKRKINVGLYHSLMIDPDKIPECLEISATASDGTIMGIRHKLLPVEGVQFHPESILTEKGKEIIKNWIYGKY